MRTQTSYLLIGVFVIAGIALITAGVVVIGAGARDRDVILAESLFEESVSGLEVGAPVRFRGVAVGRVTQITVAGALYSETRQPYVVVRFELWGPEGFPLERLREVLPQRIAEGLRVRLASTGITGIGYLEADILPDAERKYPPKPRDWVQPFAAEEPIYVPSAPSALGKVVSGVDEVLDGLVKADLPALAGEVRATLASARNAIDAFGDGRLTGEVHASLRAVRDAADALAPQVARIADRVETSSKRFDDAAERATTLFADPRLQAILDGSATAAAELTGAVAAVRTAARDLQELLAGKGRDVGAILANLERITAQLRSLLATAERYPSWLLFGTPPPPRTDGR